MQKEWMNASPAERRQLEEFGVIRVSQQDIDECYDSDNSTLYHILVYGFVAFQLFIWFFWIAPELSTMEMVAYPFMIAFGCWLVYTVVVMDDVRKEREGGDEDHD